MCLLTLTCKLDMLSLPVNFPDYPISIREEHDFYSFTASLHSVGTSLLKQKPTDLKNFLRRIFVAVGKLTA